MKFLTLFLIFLVCYGCRDGRSFHIEAIYRAPETGYDMIIISDGFISSGGDIADIPKGKVEVRPILYQQNKKLISLNVNGENNISYQIKDGALFSVEWNFRTRNKIFTDLLLESGYERADSNEIEETIKALYGVMLGPKAALLKGQTKFLHVIEVNKE